MAAAMAVVSGSKFPMAVLQASRYWARWEKEERRRLGRKEKARKEWKNWKKLTENGRSLGFGKLEQEKRSGEGRIGILLSPM
jgi:hypothetical protein